MSASLREVIGGAVPPAEGSGWHAALDRRARCRPAGHKGTWWSEHQEATMNWLALGVLLAAWNASDSDAVHPRQRPEALRGYPSVSVRAVQRTWPMHL